MMNIKNAGGNIAREYMRQKKGSETKTYNTYPCDVLAAIGMAFTVTWQTGFLFTPKEATCTYLQ